MGENIFWSGPCLLQVHFSNIHSLFHRKRLDANLIAIWCLISQPNHTYTLDEKKLLEHIKLMTPEERTAYIGQRHQESCSMSLLHLKGITSEADNAKTQENAYTSAISDRFQNSPSLKESSMINPFFLELHNTMQTLTTHAHSPL
uniref:Uncharacterized protein n=1 Tax=Oryza sativa subsp. japonica TaxID=39947 RepID=Q2QRP2_ORYSJ|nr:hypothetical protein LOC_Os12g26890 [Oryza sativa Japonica Group]